MRYKELQRFADNVNKKNKNDKEFEWFDPKRNTITLPSFATKTDTQRTIILTPTFSKLLQQYIKIKGEITIPTVQTMDDNLKRWAKKANIKNPNIIAVKTFRKTWESWLANSHKDALKILASQGHTDAVALKHYVMIGFTPDEISEMERMTEGWE
jgi:integrase